MPPAWGRDAVHELAQAAGREGHPLLAARGWRWAGGCSWPTRSPGSDLSSKKGQPRPSRHRCAFVELQGWWGEKQGTPLAEEGQAQLLGGGRVCVPPSPAVQGHLLPSITRPLRPSRQCPAAQGKSWAVCSAAVPVLSLRTRRHAPCRPWLGDLEWCPVGIYRWSPGSRGPLSNTTLQEWERPALCRSPSGHGGSSGYHPDHSHLQ